MSNPNPNADVVWAIVFNDGSFYPANGFLFSKGPDIATQHGGVRGVALVEKDSVEFVAE